MASQTVGTPAECVTPSSMNRLHRTGASLVTEKTNFTPAAAPAKGRPQLAAWNIGTIGKRTACGLRSNTDGAISAIACSIVERCS